MSQLKDFSQISQEQLLTELQTYDPSPKVLTFLKGNPALLVSLLEFLSQIEEKFPDCKIELKVFDKDETEKLRIILLSPDRTPKVLERFNGFRDSLGSRKTDNLPELAELNIRFPDSESEDTWDELDELIGAIEGPEDWAAEHDHYLYGTPKLNK